MFALLVLVGVIGGSGLYHLDNLTFVCVSGQPCPDRFIDIPLIYEQKKRKSRDSKLLALMPRD